MNESLNHPNPMKPQTDNNPLLIDTSRMSAGQRAALEMAEAARDERQNTGLAAGIFFGEPDFSSLLPFPKQSVEDRDQGDAFTRCRRFGFETAFVKTIGIGMA